MIFSGITVVRLLCHMLVLFLVFLRTKGFPESSDGKESACNAGDLGLISGSGRSPWRRECNPFQYPCLGSPMDRGFWWATIHGVATGWTRLSNTFHFHADHGAAEGKPGDTRDTLKQYLSD